MTYAKKTQLIIKTLKSCAYAQYFSISLLVLYNKKNSPTSLFPILYPKKKKKILQRSLYWSRWFFHQRILIKNSSQNLNFRKSGCAIVWWYKLYYISPAQVCFYFENFNFLFLFVKSFKKINKFSSLPFCL